MLLHENSVKKTWRKKNAKASGAKRNPRNVEWGWGGGEVILGPFTRDTLDTPHHKYHLLIARLIVKAETEVSTISYSRIYPY